MNNIIPVYDINQLSNTIENYDKVVKTKNAGESSNNKQFIIAFEKIVNGLIKK